MATLIKQRLRELELSDIIALQEAGKRVTQLTPPLVIDDLPYDDNEFTRAVKSKLQDTTFVPPHANAYMLGDAGDYETICEAVGRNERPRDFLPDDDGLEEAMDQRSYQSVVFYRISEPRTKKTR